jgi:hypothetical protein
MLAVRFKGFLNIVAKVIAFIKWPSNSKMTGVDQEA